MSRAQYVNSMFGYSLTLAYEAAGEKKICVAHDSFHQSGVSPERGDTSGIKQASCLSSPLTFPLQHI